MKKLLLDFRHISERNGFQSVLKMILKAIITDNKNEYYLLINHEDEYLIKQIKNRENIKLLYIKSKPFSFFQNIEIPYTMLRNNIKILFHINFDIPCFIFCVPNYKLIATIHDLIPIKYPEINKKSFIKQIYFGIMFKICTILSQYIMTVSEFSKKDIIDFLKVSEKKITVIHNSFEALNPLSLSADSNKEYNENPILLFVGNNFAYKNIHTVIDAVKILRDKNVIVKFNIAGGKKEYTNFLETKIQEYKLENQIKILGKVNDEELQILYKTSDIYVFPSLLEGFGIPLLEAMNAGIPIISSNRTCLPEIAGDAAILINPTAENFALKIKELIDNPQLKDELIKKGYIRIKNFTQEKYSEKILNFYNKI